MDKPCLSAGPLARLVTMHDAMPLAAQRCRDLVATRFLPAGRRSHSHVGRKKKARKGGATKGSEKSIDGQRYHKSNKVKHRHLPFERFAFILAATCLLRPRHPSPWPAARRTYVAQRTSARTWAQSAACKSMGPAPGDDKRLRTWLLYPWCQFVVFGLS